MNQPLVSIITATYNSSNFVRETIDSVLSQTDKNWELLITDDCSTDDTWRILEEYQQKDDRIKIFKLDKNSGAGTARNKSIEMASGRFIAFCDSDDLWYPDKLEKQISFMLEDRIALSYSNYDVIDEKGELIGRIFSPPDVTYWDMIKNDYFGFLTTIYDTKILGKVYLAPIRKRQDWILKLEILKKVEKAVGIKEYLAKYRVREDSISAKKYKLYPYIWRVYREYQGFSFLYSSFCIFRFTFLYLLKKNKYFIKI